MNIFNKMKNNSKKLNKITTIDSKHSSKFHWYFLPGPMKVKSNPYNLLKYIHNEQIFWYLMNEYDFKNHLVLLRSYSCKRWS